MIMRRFKDSDALEYASADASCQLIAYSWISLID